MIVSNKGKVVRPENLTSLTEGAFTEKLVDEFGAEYSHDGDHAAIYNSITISDISFLAECEITRPADVSVYAEKSLIGSYGSIELTNVSKGSATSDGRPTPKYYDGGGYITRIILRTNDTGLIGKSVWLNLNKASSANADKGILGHGYTGAKLDIAMLEIPIKDYPNTPALGFADVQNVVIPYKTALTSMYLKLITKDAFTPSANSTKIWIQLTCTKNIG